MKHIKYIYIEVFVMCNNSGAGLPVDAVIRKLNIGDDTHV